MDTGAVIEIAKQVGPLAVLAILIGWRASVAIGKFLDRFLVGFDKLTVKIEDNTAAINEHAAADAKVVRAIERLDGKFEGIILGEFTPPPADPARGASVPRGRAAISDSDHPPLGTEDETPPLGTRVGGKHRRSNPGFAPRAPTPVRGAGVYSMRGSTAREDDEK